MKKEENGYLTVEAVFWLPTISLFLVLLIVLCSYLYQGCFMMQAAYLAAFRGSRADSVQERAHMAEQQLEELLERETISFAEAEKEVDAGIVEVRITLQKETPLPDQNGGRLMLKRTQKAWYLDPVAYIRGLMFLEETKEGNG